MVDMTWSACHGDSEFTRSALVYRDGMYRDQIAVFTSGGGGRGE